MKQVGSAVPLKAQGLQKSFGAVRALDHVDLEVRPGELLTLLGPSGSGKTTLLRIVAGFEEPDEGTVLLGDRDITFLSPARRNIGMVFQNYALFPHMTVAENIGFPLRMRRANADTIGRRVAEVLNQVELKGYEHRYPRQLSGGQQQRVALARAIVFDPPLLLLDEPFGALDRKLRETMQFEMRTLQQRIGLTTLFVTHDQEEALILSDRIAVMNGGRIEQLDVPSSLYERSANLFVADFIGESNLLAGRLLKRDGLNAHFCLLNGDIVIADTGEGKIEHDEKAVLMVRPERVRVLKRGEPADNVFAATVLESAYLGQTQKLRVRLATGTDLVIRAIAPEHGQGPRAGEQIHVGWSARDGRLLRPQAN
jgi:putative spermidine/putrescine transport system ATP-binding protein